MSTAVDDPAIRRDALATAPPRRYRDRRPPRSSRSSTRRRARRTTPRRSRATSRSPPRASTSAARSPATDEARTLLVAEHMAAADKARAAGKCAEVRTEVAEVMRLEPRNLLARDLVRLCKPKQEVAVAKPARRWRRRRPSPRDWPDRGPARRSQRRRLRPVPSRRRHGRAPKPRRLMSRQPTRTCS